MGDPSGIGPEVLAEALAARRVQNAMVPIVFGDGSFRSRGRHQLEAVTRLAAKDRRPGRPSLAGGKAQLAYVQAAVAAAKAGRVQALCTAPVSKEQISRSGTPFMGHTELLAESFGVEVLMLMDGPRLKVALATNHLALSDVPRALEKGRLAAQLVLLSSHLRAQLGRRPRLAVCSLNPHAGEGGLLGTEEQRVLEPAMALARARGVVCEGPLAADGLFARFATTSAQAKPPFDAVLAMYHDQGLVAAKALDFVLTVNVTVGLPVPRTSPDHGVAYALAGKGRADSLPMREALLKAAELARSAMP